MNNEAIDIKKYLLILRMNTIRIVNKYCRKSGNAIFKPFLLNITYAIFVSISIVLYTTPEILAESSTKSKSTEEIIERHSKLKSECEKDDGLSSILACKNLIESIGSGADDDLLEWATSKLDEKLNIVKAEHEAHFNKLQITEQELKNSKKINKSIALESNYIEDEGKFFESFAACEIDGELKTIISACEFLINSKKLDENPEFLSVAYNNLARAQYFSGDFRSASDGFRTAAWHDGKNAVFHRNEGVNRERLAETPARKFVKRDTLIGSLEAYSSAIEADPDDPIAYELRGQLRMRFSNLKQDGKWDLQIAAKLRKGAKAIKLDRSELLPSDVVPVLFPRPLPADFNESPLVSICLNKKEKESRTACENILQASEFATNSRALEMAASKLVEWNGLRVKVREARRICSEEKPETSPDSIIDACTLFRSNGAGEEDLYHIHDMRSRAYIAKNDLKRALLDLEEGLRLVGFFDRNLRENPLSYQRDGYFRAKIACVKNLLVGAGVAECLNETQADHSLDAVLAPLLEGIPGDTTYQEQIMKLTQKEFFYLLHMIADGGPEGSEKAIRLLAYREQQESNVNLLPLILNVLGNKSNQSGDPFADAMNGSVELQQRVNRANEMAAFARNRIYALDGKFCSPPQSVVACTSISHIETSYIGRGLLLNNTVTRNSCSGRCRGADGLCDMSTGQRYSTLGAAESSNCRSASKAELERYLKLPPKN
jgi:tetratricopeptide (TPR) repeat protein